MKMPFGKYKGVELADIPADYIDWLLGNIDDLREPLKGELEKQSKFLRGEGIDVAPAKPRTTVINVSTTRNYDVHIGRPTKYGNPYVMSRTEDGNRDEVISKFKEWFFSDNERARELRADAKQECTGRILGCYCKPLPCHGDVIAAYCNGELDEQGNDITK